MRKKLPSIVITGASGFIGCHIVDFLKDDFKIFAIARRSRKEAAIPYHNNIKWIQWDIGNKVNFNEVKTYIKKQGGADFVVHLAGFYDFKYDENPEYYRTNVEGTIHVLELAKYLKVQRFIFASSLAACKFPKSGEVITEKTPPNAQFAYARSKKEGEINVNIYSNYFPCSIVRFAAVFSDWCEYAPLYKFMDTWLTKNYASRILAGRGESAITYIHIKDLCKLFLKIIEKTEKLKWYDIYNASPNGFMTHKELFNLSTRGFYGKTRNPIYLPKILAFPGILVKNLLGKIGITKEAFEKLWMVKYIDQQLRVDSTYTQETLDWVPKARYHVAHRLLFMLVNMKSHQAEWTVRNEAALKHPAKRPNLIIYEQMVHLRKDLLEQLETYILSNEQEPVESYQNLDRNKFRSYLSALYNLLMACVRSADRSLMIKYIDNIALQRFMEGFEVQEVQFVLDSYTRILVPALQKRPELKNMEQAVYDNIALTLQLGKDEIEDIYENLEEKLSDDRIAHLNSLRERRNTQKKIKQLSEFYQHHPSS